MTVWVHRTIIVPASLVIQARELGAALDAAGHNMYTTPLSATGKAPATHYISSGLISAAFVHLLADPEQLYAYAQAGAEAQNLTLKATQADADGLKELSVISEGDPFVLMDELGLKMVNDDPKQ